jgi:hypothetical protein
VLCGEASAGAGSTAFKWAHASWDNAKSELPSDSKAEQQGRVGRRPLATRFFAASAPYRAYIRTQP